MKERFILAQISPPEAPTPRIRATMQDRAPKILSSGILMPGGRVDDRTCDPARERRR
jgi:hypothetical protein